MTAPQPVASREELVFLLTMGAELEHAIACLYLFAACSLKTDVAEGGVNAAQVAMTRRWRRTLNRIAIMEMLHLAQVNNLLTAVGGPPHLRHPNFPQPAAAYPFGIGLTLEPVSTPTLRRFVCLELPERLTDEHRAVYEPMRAELAEEGSTAADEDEGASEEGLEAFPIDFATIGDFYRKIEDGFRTLTEEELFIGPVDAQAEGASLDFGEQLVHVTGRASALAALEMIILQGEGAREDAPDSHFTLLDAVRREHEAESLRARASGEPFQPARAVVPNPLTRRHADAGAGGTVIVDPRTHRAAEIFDVAYEALLHTLLRYFADTDETPEERGRLARGALSLMTDVVGPLGVALTKMPFGGAHHPGMTAGPSFATSADIELLPHKDAARRVIGELLRRPVAPLTELCVEGAPAELTRARDGLVAIAASF